MMTNDAQQVVFVGDIVEENGKTVKENNTARVHQIPLGSLVEITCDGELNGLRLFVVHHSRDCDGEPLYDLSFEKTAKERVEIMEQESNPGNELEFRLQIYFKGFSYGKILTHLGQDSLKVIK